MSEFVDHLHEVFRDFGSIGVRRMFGGYGIYHGGVMFALVSDEVLYLKADDATAAFFESRGLGRFQYRKSGAVVSLSYFEAPEEIFDDPEAALEWARRAYDAALRARSQSTRKSRS